MIKVLVVEDSEVALEFLVYILKSDPNIQVIGTARNGEEALAAVRQKSPDVITMDISMPIMNGLEATRKIMETYPTPIIIVSGSQDPNDVEKTFRAIEAGALAVLQKPYGIGHPQYETMINEIIQTVKLMSEVKVVRRFPRYIQKSRSDRVSPLIDQKIEQKIQLVAIGASTGGPIAIKTILTALPKHFPVPVVIVQHMSTGFIQGFADWLSQTTSLPAHLAKQEEYMLSGHVYIAPDGLQMKVEENNKIFLIPDEPENGHRPSVSYLFRSVANIWGEHAIGILLTGMGKDGANGLKIMKDYRAITMAQDQESSVVYGMPGEAVKLEAAAYVLSPQMIALAVLNLFDLNPDKHIPILNNSV